MGLSEQWVVRRRTLSETVPQAERVGVSRPNQICGELVLGVNLVGAVCDLAWSKTWPVVFSWYADAEGSLVYFPSNPSLTQFGRQSEHVPDSQTVIHNTYRSRETAAAALSANAIVDRQIA